MALSGELKQPESKAIVPGRRCHMFRGLCFILPWVQTLTTALPSLIGRPASGRAWTASP